MKYYIPKEESNPARFVEFWAGFYNDKNEHIYPDNIDQCTPESIRKLYAWKAMQINRNTIKAGGNPFVEAVIADLDRFRKNPPDDRRSK